MSGENLYFLLLEREERPVKEKNGLRPLTMSLRFMLKIIFSSSIDETVPRRVFSDVTVFSNLEASLVGGGQSRLLLPEQLIGGRTA